MPLLKRFECLKSGAQVVTQTNETNDFLKPPEDAARSSVRIRH